MKGDGVDCGNNSMDQETSGRENFQIKKELTAKGKGEKLY